VTFDELSLMLQTLVGQPIHKVLVVNTIILYFYLRPIDDRFVTIRLNTPWRYSQNGKVILGSYDLYLEDDPFPSKEEASKEFHFRCAFLDNLEGSRLESIVIDSESSDLLMRFSDGQILRNFTTSALDEESWTFRDRRTGFAAFVSHAGVATIEETPEPTHDEPDVLEPDAK